MKLLSKKCSRETRIRGNEANKLFHYVIFKIFFVVALCIIVCLTFNSREKIHSTMDMEIMHTWPHTLSCHLFFVV